jgi:hypothetical protein
MVYDAPDGTGTRHIIERRQAGRVIGQAKKGMVIGVAIRVARQ